MEGKTRYVRCKVLPDCDQYTTSAVGLLIGDQFRLWDQRRFTAPGAPVELNLAEQEHLKTAESFWVEADRERDGSVVLPPYTYRGYPWHLLGITRERVNRRKSH